MSVSKEKLNTIMKIAVIVPAYNAEESLAGVVSDLREHIPSPDVLVLYEIAPQEKQEN